jgi:hypothetical protein
MFAARNGHKLTVEALLSAPGIDVKQRNRVGRTAMHYAAQFAHGEIVKMLRDHSAMKQDKSSRYLADALELTPKDVALEEKKDVEDRKQRIWGEQVYKEGQFRLVEPLKKTDKPDQTLLGPLYNGVFGIHDPDSVKVLPRLSATPTDVDLCGSPLAVTGSAKALRGEEVALSGA